MENYKRVANFSVVFVREMNLKIKKKSFYSVNEIDELKMINGKNIEYLVQNISDIKQNKNNKIYTGYLSKIESNLALLKGINVKIENLLKKGGSVKKQNPKIQWFDIESSFQKRIQTGAIINNFYKDPKEFLLACETILINKISEMLVKSIFLKINIVLSLEYELIITQITDVKTFTSKNYVIDSNINMNNTYTMEMVKEILTKIEDFEDKGSGWSLKSIINLKLNTNEYAPMTAAGST